LVYRRTERVAQRLAARRAAILNAASATGIESGFAAIAISAIAERAGVAAGTIYRYFPSKTALIRELIKLIADEDVEALNRAANTAPGPLSALAAAILNFALRGLARRQLMLALLAEPSEPRLGDARMSYRKALEAEFEELIRRAVAAGQLADAHAPRSAPVLVRVLTNGLIAQLASIPPGDSAKARLEIQELAVFALRGLGVMDARARGLVVACSPD
jgi:AcrR family transcriptional regulator